METLLTMTEKELKRIKVIEQVIQKRLTQKQASEELKLSLRQIKRLTTRLRDQGAEGLISQKRSRPGNHHYPISLREYVVSLITKHYRDFRPTFATEMLAERHSLHFSKETIRSWMIAAELWIPRDKRRERAYQPRYRRSCMGELIQIDGSEHAWFENRGPKCTLLVYIDDATSKIMEARFVESESTYSYFEATRSYLERHGKPQAFYSDKHSVFRTNKKGELGGDGITQFGRALHDLNIDIICANTSQAKGRVERANRTLQDRLIKEMRLADISSMDDGNRFLEYYINKFNAHFGKAALDSTNVHRPLLPSDNLDDIFCWHEERTLSNNLTLQYDKVLYLIKDSVKTRKLKRKRVLVYDYPNANIEIRYQGKPLEYQIFDKLERIDQGQITDNKRLGNVLNYIKEKQDQRDEKSSVSCPTRTHLGKETSTALRKQTVIHRNRPPI